MQTHKNCQCSSSALPQAAGLALGLEQHKDVPLANRPLTAAILVRIGPGGRSVRICNLKYRSALADKQAGAMCHRTRRMALGHRSSPPKPPVSARQSYGDTTIVRTSPWDARALAAARTLTMTKN
jgi:hypothetical protein